jgi:hypothetical protein
LATRLPVAEPSANVKYIADQKDVPAVCELLEKEGKIESGACILVI